MLFEDAIKGQVSQLGELSGIDEIFEHAWSAASNPFEADQPIGKAS